MSSGSVRTFRSHRTLPTSSTTQTDVSSTETSKPTKCVIAATPSPMLEVRPTPIQSSYVKGLHVHRWKDQAQPPRYTIFTGHTFPSVIEVRNEPIEAAAVGQRLGESLAPLASSRHFGL